MEVLQLTYFGCKHNQIVIAFVFIATLLIFSFCTITYVYVQTSESYRIDWLKKWTNGLSVLNVIHS